MFLHEFRYVVRFISVTNYHFWGGHPIGHRQRNFVYIFPFHHTVLSLPISHTHGRSLWFWEEHMNFKLYSILIILKSHEQRMSLLFIAKLSAMCIFFFLFVFSCYLPFFFAFISKIRPISCQLLFVVHTCFGMHYRIVAQEWNSLPNITFIASTSKLGSRHTDNDKYKKSENLYIEYFSVCAYHWLTHTHTHSVHRITYTLVEIENNNIRQSSRGQ